MFSDTKMNPLYIPYTRFLEESENSNTLRELTSIDRCDDHQKKSSRFIQYQNESYLNLSSNDYLALSSHPSLSERSADWAEKYGTGTGSSRLVTGNLSIFEKVERKISHYRKKEAALIMGAGFQTNATILQALFNKQVLKDTPLIFSDRLNHASIHFGCAAAQVKQIRYHHCDVNHLKDLLQQHQQSQQPKFIITETIFSMDGDEAPLAKISLLAKEYNAILIIDDAHSIGSDELNSKYENIADIIIGTFSKAFGSYGSYVAANQKIINYLKNRCSGFIYSTALPPPILGAIDSAIDLMPHLQSQRKHLKNISKYLSSELLKKGFSLPNSPSHIIPLILKDSKKSMVLTQKLKKNKIWATTIRYPTVPKNSARIRFSLTSALTEQDIEKTLSIIL